jgi:hypothetical protein
MFHNLLEWHDSWCPPTLCGGRPGADALQTALELGLTLEEALELGKRGLLMVSLDLSKFFDSIEWGLIDGLAKEFGLPDSFRDGFMRFLGGLKRKMRVGDTYSEDWFTSTCGTPQGDAMSILWANLASTLLAKSLARSSARVGLRIYVDDRYIWVRNTKDLRNVLGEVHRFDFLCRNRLNPDKTKVLATSAFLRKKAADVTFEGHPLNIVKQLKGLGVTLSSCRRPYTKDADARGLKAAETAKRAKRSLAPWAFRKRVISCKIHPQLCYSAPFARPRRAVMRKLRSANVALVWGRGRSKRSPEMALLVCTDPVRSDPEMAIASETIFAIIRLVNRKPELLGRISTLLRKYEGQNNMKGVNANFPLRRFKDAIKVLGAKISAAGVFSHPATPDLILHRMTVRELSPFIRDAVRFKLASDLATRSSKLDKNGKPGRRDFQTLSPHIDWDSTLSIFKEKINAEKGTGLTEERSKALTTLLTGSQRTCERLFRHQEPLHPGLQPLSSPECPFCEDGCDETLQHIFWGCDAYESVRQPFLEAFQEYDSNSQGEPPVAQWSPCRKHYGLIPEDERILAWKRSIPSEDSYPPLPKWEPDPALPCVSADGRKVFATDGGTDHPREGKIRLSGIGIFSGGTSSWQYKSLLRGPVQQNDKAELVAAVLLAEAIVKSQDDFPGGVQILIDNQAVCDGAASLVRGSKPKPTVAHLWWWRRLEVAILTLTPNFFLFTWIPSHCTKKDVADGKISEMHRHLNAGADALATLGKAEHSLTENVVLACQARRDISRVLHLMLITIHGKRKEKEEAWILRRKSSAPIVLRNNAQEDAPPANLALVDVATKVPLYCYTAGGGGGVVPHLGVLLRPVSLNLDTKSNRNAVEAIKWYWAQLSWPEHPSALNRGVSWLELTVDFISATGVSFIGTGHKSCTDLGKAKLAFTKVTLELFKLVPSLFPHAEGKVTSLGPLGVRNAVRGLKVAPRLLRMAEWLPLFHLTTKDSVSPWLSLVGLTVGQVPSPVPRPYLPLREGFLRTFHLPPPLLPHA